MSNKKAVLGITLSYVDEFGSAKAIPAQSLQCPYQGQNHGELDVPASEASATAHAIPFGSVAKATCVLVINRTAQELEVTENGVPLTENLPAGGMRVYGATAVASANPFVSLSLKTTIEQVDAGTIGYFVFGDPV